MTQKELKGYERHETDFKRIKILNPSSTMAWQVGARGGPYCRAPMLYLRQRLREPTP